MYKIIEQKDRYGLVYVVQEENKPYSKINTLNRDNLLFCNELSGLGINRNNA